MRVLDRYIISAILGSVVLVMAVLATLLALFLFFDEQGWVGVGSYGNLAAVRYVALNLPATLVQFLPVAALIGALKALGMLAQGSELTVIRASGVPTWRLAVTVLMAGALLVPVAVATGEYLAPPLTRTARIDKAVQRNANISVTGRGSAWILDGGRILRAERLRGDTGFGGITVFELAADNQLTAVGRAEGAQATASGGWELEGYAESRLAPSRITTASSYSSPLTTSATPAFLSAIVSDPEELGLRELGRIIAHLDASGQETRRYRFAYWSKLAGTAAIPFAVLLALPFVWGSARSAQGSVRAAVGLAFGLSWFLLQKIVASGTIAFGFDPMLLAWAPALLLAAVALFLLMRLERFPNAA